MKNSINSLIQSIRNFAAISAVVILVAGCEKDEVESKAKVVTGTGDISSKVNEFRALLGSQLNTTPGAIGGRREVNWDGVPADLLNKPLPGDFFNTVGSSVPPTRQRGLVYSAGVNNFQVSSDGFVAVNPSTAAAFTPFSGTQEFSNVGSNLWDIGFQVPGQPDAASVKGFGMVFLDVDTPNSTFMEFFNGSESVGKFFAPVHDPSTNLSFLGVYFNDQKITHVRIRHDGTLTEGGNDISNGGQKDFVAFDDFLFDEPVKQ